MNDDNVLSMVFPDKMNIGIIAGLQKKIFRDIIPAVANEQMASSTSGLGRSPLKAKTRVRTSLRLPKLRMTAFVKQCGGFCLCSVPYLQQTPYPQQNTLLQL